AGSGHAPRARRALRAQRRAAARRHRPDAGVVGRARQAQGRLPRARRLLDRHARARLQRHALPPAAVGGARRRGRGRHAAVGDERRAAARAAGGRGRSADLVPTPGSLDDMLDAAGAALLIGDAALSEAVRHLQPRQDGPVARGASGRSVVDPDLYVTDLGERWYRLTRLPFTFAVWASRHDRPPPPDLLRRFRAARADGLGRLAEVAAVEARRLGLPTWVVQRYLENFRYHLEPPDRDG